MRNLSLKYGFVAVLCSLVACTGEKPAALDESQASLAQFCLDGLRISVTQTSAAEPWQPFSDLLAAAKQSSYQKAIPSVFTDVDGSRVRISKQLREKNLYAHWSQVRYINAGSKSFHWGNYVFRTVKLEHEGGQGEIIDTAVCSGDGSCLMSDLFQGHSTEGALVENLLHQSPQDRNCENKRVSTIELNYNGVDNKHPIKIDYSDAAFGKLANKTLINRFLTSCSEKDEQGEIRATEECSQKYDDLYPTWISRAGRLTEKLVGFNELIGRASSQNTVFYISKRKDRVTIIGEDRSSPEYGNAYFRLHLNSEAEMLVENRIDLFDQILFREESLRQLFEFSE